MILATTTKRFAQHALIRAVLEGVQLSGAGRAWRTAVGRGEILTLHHVADDAIAAALECGLTPLALEDLPERLADQPDRRRYVCFTLDDGYRDNARFAAPVFRKHGVPYTIFITAGFVERSRQIWWETAEEIVRCDGEISFDFNNRPQTLQLRTETQKIAAFERFSSFVQQAEDEDQVIAALDRLARQHGIDPLAITDRLTMDADALKELAADPLARFGAHTLTHPNLRHVSEERLREEIIGSARAVERYTGAWSKSFAYPYGFPAAVARREAKAVAEAGFRVAVTSFPGLVTSDALARPTLLNRVSLNGLHQKKRFVKALLSGVPFMLHGKRDLADHVGEEQNSGISLQGRWNGTPFA